MTVLIRDEGPADRDAALEVERAAFDTELEAEIVAAVRDEKDSFALVAEDDNGAVIGHIQFSRAWIGETVVVALGPVGVVPERHGRGIGSALIRTGLDRARERGEGGFGSTGTS